MTRPESKPPLHQFAWCEGGRSRDRTATASLNQLPLSFLGSDIRSTWASLYGPYFRPGRRTPTANRRSSAQRRRLKPNEKKRGTRNSLKSIAPEDAIEWYLEERAPEIRSDTRSSIASALEIFQEWCRSTGLDNLNHLDGRRLYQFRSWRRDTSDIELITLNGNLAILRRFLRFAEEIEAVEEGLAEKVPMPNVAEDQMVNDFVPDDDLVWSIAEYLETYSPNSRAHCEHELIRGVGLRMGAVRAIDMRDFDPDRQEIKLLHRPEDGHDAGTPLKNGDDGQRLINISETMTEVLKTYIEGPRDAVTDQFGREPLLTTEHGRVTRSTIRRDFYKISRPCIHGGSCPHGRVIDDCPATANHKASECPSSYSPHPLRRWSIMYQLDQGVPKDLLSNRVDVSVPVLEQHYDHRSETRKGRKRRETLENYLDGY